MKKGRTRKFQRGDAVIHRGQVKAVQGISRARTDESLNGGNLYYNVKASDHSVTAVRSDVLHSAVGAW